MAERKPPQRPGAGPRPASNRPAGSRPTAAKSAPGRPPAKKSKSIVNQKQTPWGLITVTAVIVVFAIAIVGYALVNRKSGGGSTEAGADVSKCTKMIGTNATSYLNELQCAKDISGVTFKQEPNRTHVTTTVTYDASPPVGGDHSPIWADCDGQVYSEPIANENAVHMLEHGTVWITYKPGLASSQVDALAKLVTGKDHLAMSPYTGLTSAISLQSWGYQLFVDSASDPRIEKFIAALQFNPKTTPEYGAACTGAGFNAADSTPGHPQETAASG